MADFKITDRRHSARPRGSGLVLGQSVAAAKEQRDRMMGPTAARALEAGRSGVSPTDVEQGRRMALQRLQKTGAYIGGTGGGSSVSFATQKTIDPFDYWRRNNLPYDFNDPEHLKRLRALCRHIYRAHSVMASAIDVYSKWPLTDMEIDCKDKDIRGFYEDLFFENLKYEEYLPDVLKEYWTVGEAFPLGSFNETLGVWEADELLNPDDVFVIKSPFLREEMFYIQLPQSLRTVLATGQPREQYHALMRSYPELKAYAARDAKMPVSNVLLKHLKFKTDTFGARGLPILYRALRPLMQEEMLNAAQDAVADRLYTPLIHARIGASATDLGTEEPWIPTEGQIQNFESALDIALAADFRVLTTHFAVDMDTVLGRETMPDFDADYDRLTEKQLQSFGLSKTFISGGDAGETYAADAMNRDVISQLLGDAQRYVKRLFRSRAEVVAEAMGHYDYEIRGGKRYPIMEEILEIDEETGEERIVEQPKLLVPELKLRAMSMKDEADQRGFIESLRESGVPISQKRRVQFIPDLDLEKETEELAEEQVEQAVEAQRVRKRTYERLKAERLPIPDDLIADFEPKAKNGEGLTQDEEAEQAAADATRVPMLGTDPQDTSALAPTPDALATPPGAPLGVPAGPGGTIADPAGGDPTAAPAAQQGATVIPLPTPQWSQRNPSRPPESDEQRKHMPKPAALHTATGQFDRTSTSFVDVQPLGEDPETGEPLMAKPGGLVTGPQHIGWRRWAGIDKDTPLDEPAPEEEAQ